MRSKRTWLPALVLVIALGAAGPAAGKTPIKGVLYIQPLGKQLPNKDVALVKEALLQFYKLELKVLPRAELPRRAYYKPRKRYRAEKLLNFLERRMPSDGVRILGLTGVDISTTKGRYRDWGILGLASMDGAACVISSFRCHKRSRGVKHARDRLAKVAVHEIGHTLGLPHCPTVGCLMEDAKGKVATCDREFDICPKCRRMLTRWGRTIPAKPTIPWPRPK